MTTVFSPIKIGNVEIKNRMAVAPTVKNLAATSGYVTERILENYSIEADGPGLYIVSMTFTEKQGHVFKGQTGIHDERAIFGMAEVANRIHKAGAKTFLQISHGGNLCSKSWIGETPVGPSDIEQWPGEAVRELTTEEVYAIADNYGKAAERAKRAGFDGIEMHGCHGSLMLQFLSKLQNCKRTDKFADGKEFLYEAVRRAQHYCGEDFPIGVRLSCHEYMMEDTGREGFTWDECKELVVELEKMGVAYIHASAGRIGHTPDRTFPPLYEPRGVNLKFSQMVKELVNIPVITVGRFQDPKLIKKVIREGSADLVAMCRPVIADSHIAKKICDGKDEDVRQCMGCNWCLEKLFIQESLECPMNPAYGWETEYALKPVTTPKKVMVVGGGVAGLQTAYAAATRGHKVSLYEKADVLGGQTRIAASMPSLYTRELWNLPRWLIRQINKLDVDIHLGEEVTEELINKVNPEVVVFATGATEIPAEFAGTKVSTMWDYLQGKVEVGKNVVVTGSEAVELAASLCNERKKVTIVQKDDDFQWPDYITPGGARREPLTKMLQKADKRFGSEIVKVTEDEVTIKTGDNEESIPYDNLIISNGRTKNNALYYDMVGKNREVYCIGDARDVRTILNASHEGYWVGRTI